MSRSVDVDEVAAGLRSVVGLLVRRLRETPSSGELTLSERSALSRLDHGGPATSSALAKVERISPQSMGAIVRALQARGLVERKPDPADGRQVLLSATEDGRELIGQRRTERTARLAAALAAGFTQAELAQLATAVPLIQRLAEHV
jgi:DNA-binding MarR family transcriptional regulator